MEQRVIDIHSLSLSPGGTLDNGAELAVLGQFREGGEICHSLCIPSFLQGNEVS